jgi:hypothetical protein
MARSARVPTTWRAGRREKDRDAGEEEERLVVWGGSR